MTAPLVSVIIPTFNRAAWVGEAIASVCAQTYTPQEVIVVDDGSQDATAEVVHTFGSAMTYLPRPHAGVSAARNAGVAQSHGEFVAFLDSDDLWLPGKVAAQIALFQQYPDTQVCYTDEVWIRHGVRVNQKRIHHKHSGWMFEQSLPRCVISPSSVMIRRGFWEQHGGFDETLPACEDYDLWLRFTRVTPIALLPERLIIKRGGHADQLSRSVPILDQYRILALEKLLTASLTASQRQAVLTHLVEKCTIVAQGAGKRQQDARAALYRAKAQQYQEQQAALSADAVAL